MRPAMYENPSAGKFDPPASRDERPAFERFRVPRILIAALILAGTVFFEQWGRSGGRGWRSGIMALGLVAMAGLEHVLSRLHSSGEKDDPYTPPTHITR